MDRQHASLRSSPCNDCKQGAHHIICTSVYTLIQDEDGFKLYELRAIVRYLVRKYAPQSSIVPSSDDLQRYGLFEQAMSIEAFDFGPPLMAILYETAYKP